MWMFCPSTTAFSPPPTHTQKVCCSSLIDKHAQEVSTFPKVHTSGRSESRTASVVRSCDVNGMLIIYCMRCTRAWSYCALADAGNNVSWARDSVPLYNLNWSECLFARFWTAAVLFQGGDQVLASCLEWLLAHSHVRPIVDVRFIQ